MKRAPVGIGIVGTGFARSTQIPGFRDCMGAKIVAIASGRRERAEAVAKEFGIENPMAIPKVEKIVVNMGVGEAIGNAKVLDAAKESGELARKVGKAAV